jgi:hypothetical protein
VRALINVRIMKRLFAALAVAAVALDLAAGFPGTDLILPAAGRVQGAGGSQFYTTLWVTNASATESADATIEFLRAGQGNITPPRVSIGLAPGQTKTFENATETLFGISGVLGGLRVRSSKPVLVASRIYNQNDGQTVAGSTGLFYAGVPADFAIGNGQSGALQGVRQDVDFRYNAFIVEASGSSVRVRLDVRDGSGNAIAASILDLQPFEQRLVPLSSLFSANVSDGVLAATVIGGDGRVIVCGSLIANTSQDASGFEMAFRPELLGNAVPGPQARLGGNDVAAVAFDR